jgi:alanine dehydrogenase
MPGAVPRTSTLGLVHSSFQYIQAIANKGFKKAIKEDQALKAGVSIYQHQLMCSAVGQSQNRPYVSIDTMI